MTAYVQFIWYAVTPIPFDDHYSYRKKNRMFWCDVLMWRHNEKGQFLNFKLNDPRVQDLQLLLLYAQEAELHAWREVVHELEDKRMEDTVRIEALIQDNQVRIVKHKLT